MKIFLLVLALLLFPSSAFAHVSNESVFTVNGKPADVNKSQELRENLFNLPPDSDQAPENYLIHETLTFETETAHLAFDQKTIENTNYSWNFGDGTKEITQKGATTYSHAYEKIGTFNLRVYADYDGKGKRLVQSLLLNILPDASYILPQAAILIDNNLIKTPSLDIALGDTHVFKAATITSPTSRIVSYEWDFDDGTTNNKESTEHKFQLPQYSAAVALRITDENGFYSDTVVNLENNGANEPPIPGNLKVKYVAALGVAVISLVVLFVVFKKKKK